jgi:cytoskeletal protein RodZ
MKIKKTAPPAPEEKTIAIIPGSEDDKSSQTKKLNLKNLGAGFGIFLICLSVGVGFFLIKQRQEIREVRTAAILTPSPTPSLTPSPTPSLTPSPTPSPTPTPSSTPTPTGTITPTPTGTATPTPPGETSTPSPSSTPTPGETTTATPTPTETVPEAGGLVPTTILGLIGLTIILLGVFLPI